MSHDWTLTRRQPTGGEPPRCARCAQSDLRVPSTYDLAKPRRPAVPLCTNCAAFASHRHGIVNRCFNPDGLRADWAQL